VTTNVLAICTEGGIGDLLAASPAMRAIHRHFGEPLSVLASPYAAPILQDNPSVREMLLDDGTLSARDLASVLNSRSFSHAVVFWSTARIASAVRAAGIPVRVGQSKRLYSWMYTKQVPVRTESGDQTSHWTDVQMDYARSLGIASQPDDFYVDIRLRSADFEEADALIAADGLGERFAVFHAARGLALDRVRWPVTRFAEIADAIGTEFSAKVALTGSTADAPTISALGRDMAMPHAVAAGRTSLMGLSALLKRASLVVALDSGPMHVAAALGVPTVGIFALRTDLPDRWRPLGPRVAVIRPSYPCPPWHRKETCRTFECYAHLAPGAVVEAARSAVASGGRQIPAKAP
jgi:ADP-heptose:LPS heptosyltransferase